MDNAEKISILNEILHTNTINPSIYKELHMLITTNSMLITIPLFMYLGYRVSKDIEDIEFIGREIASVLGVVVGFLMGVVLNTIAIFILNTSLKIWLITLKM